VSFADDQGAVGVLGPGGEDERSAKQFVRGQRGGIFAMSIPAPAWTASNGGELAGPVADEESDGGGAVVKVHQQVAGLWVVQAPSGDWSRPGCVRSGCGPPWRRAHGSVSG
jgi:hypothetical protein